jgi:hypothetical protein
MANKTWSDSTLNITRGKFGKTRSQISSEVRCQARLLLAASRIVDTVHLRQYFILSKTTAPYQLNPCLANELGRTASA